MHRPTFLALAGMTLLLLGGLPGGISHAADYPFQGQANFSLDGTIDRVDTDRDRVILHGDNGRVYTVDTYQTRIVLRDTDSPGTTADLVPGMRLHVAGTLASSDIIEADVVTVQPLRSVRPVGPVSPNAPILNPASEPITLRGTVGSVDERRSLFIVRVRDHTRTIYLNDQTDLQDVDFGGSGERIPVHPGDRVYVSGLLRRDGTVLASSVRGLAPPARYGSTTFQRLGGVLTGPITMESSRYMSRDIKIRAAADREVTVHVPHGVVIRKESHSISVHDLRKDDIVRVEGTPDGSDYKATRIEVLHANDQGY